MNVAMPQSRGGLLPSSATLLTLVGEVVGAVSIMLNSTRTYPK